MLTSKFTAVQATVGKRRCWRLAANSATCAKQGCLFDPMSKPHYEEAPTYGFLRLRCADCAHEKLVAFSCKKRWLLPPPAARRSPVGRRIASKIWATSSGAIPSVGSSSSTKRGRDMSVCPTASICCSPPDSVPARCCARFRRIGNSSWTVWELFHSTGPVVSCHRRVVIIPAIAWGVHKRATRCVPPR